MPRSQAPWGGTVVLTSAGSRQCGQTCKKCVPTRLLTGRDRSKCSVSTLPTVPERHAPPPPHPVTPKRTASRTPLIGLSIASLLFLISLFTDTLQTASGSGFLLGFVCLLFGWGVHLSWLANPLLFFSGILLLTRQPGGAACFASFALPLMLTALQIKETWINEAGTKGPVTGYGPGFYLWICHRRSPAHHGNYRARRSSPPTKTSRLRVVCLEGSIAVGVSMLVGASF
jgi:hypothetical protein